ncbi:LAFE_0F13520g1_1 [Lachancea fermentati]|uniref:non-specific serine/threonine protein kinase n=1 Tax=Lachancea fermentati TaxID=4955 RepID=A0A1G4MG30_LACFM|nr:LAFE_0F13520g1_1 [Lachancea fermentati]
MGSKRTPQDYIFREKLGQGSYSTVFRAVERGESGRNYAIKVCSKKHIIRERKVKYVTIEKDTLNSLACGGHPGIVRLFCTFHDADNLYFVLEYVSGGELLGLVQRVGQLSEEWARQLMAQLVDTVDYMHSKGVIHRDLKPENVLLSQEGRVVITDFGAACKAEKSVDERTASFVGTAEYVSPELLLHSQCSFSSDVWALGCILFQLMQGTPPFRGETELQTFEKIVSLDYKWRTPAPPAVVSLVQRILVLNPQERATIAQIKAHQWFQSIDWNNKEKLWRGVWQLRQQAKLPRPNGRTPGSMPAATAAALAGRTASGQLHVIDTPASGIRIARRKPVRATSTSTIVEWRKKLGLGTLPTPVGTTPPASKPSSTPQSVPKQAVVATPGIPRPPYSAPPTPGSQSPRPLTPPTSAPPPVLKRDNINILEIPYVPNSLPISVSGYSAVDDSIITEFVTNSFKKLLESSTNCILSLDVRGHLTSKKPNQAPSFMVSVSDPDLSMYDYEFDEKSNTGFLILEKYKKRLWFLSITQAKLDTPIQPVNREKSWVECFFTARKMIKDSESPRESQKQKPLSAGKTVQPKRKASPKFAAPPNMVLSSSRYEVLHTLSAKGVKGGDASSGASAAFKSLQQR